MADKVPGISSNTAPTDARLVRRYYSSSEGMSQQDSEAPEISSEIGADLIARLGSALCRRYNDMAAMIGAQTNDQHRLTPFVASTPAGSAWPYPKNSSRTFGSFSRLIYITPAAGGGGLANEFKFHWGLPAGGAKALLP